MTALYGCSVKFFVLNPTVRTLPTKLVKGFQPE